MPDQTSKTTRSNSIAPADLATHQLAVAQEWHRRGYAVIPLHPAKKRPLVAGFARTATPEQLAPFYNAEQIHAWWTGPYKRAHVGLLTGRSGQDGRGLLVVDCDIRKPTDQVDPRYADAASGVDVIEQLAADAGADWPDTYTVQTPSGGVHLYFQQPTDGPLLGCSTRTLPCVDSRGHGGVIVAPGSYSAHQGVAYRRISPPDVLPAPLPDWIHRLLAPPVTEPSPQRPRPHVPTAGARADRYATTALNRLADDVAAAGPGIERWKALTAAAFRCAELHHTAPTVLSEQAITHTLVDAATAAGMDSREAGRIIRTAWAKSLHKTGARA